MTAKEMTAAIRLLRWQGEAGNEDDGRDLWKHAIGNGVELRVRCIARRHLGSEYLVWVTRRGWDSPLKRGWSSKKLTAMTAETAGNKARSLATRYGGAP